MQKRKARRLTRGNVVVRFDGDVMSELHDVDSLQNGQTLANRGDTYFLQVFRAHQAEHIPSKVMLYGRDGMILARRKNHEEKAPTFEIGLVLWKTETRKK
jgi:hypothetical protein